MALSTYRVKLTQAVASYNAAETIWVTPQIGRSLVDLGLATAIDPLPGGLLATDASKGPRHAVRVAKANEVIGSEADRQLVQMMAAIQ